MGPPCSTFTACGRTNLDPAALDDPSHGKRWAASWQEANLDLFRIPESSLNQYNPRTRQKSRLVFSSSLDMARIHVSARPRPVGWEACRRMPFRVPLRHRARAPPGWSECEPAGSRPAVSARPSNRGRQGSNAHLQCAPSKQCGMAANAINPPCGGIFKERCRTGGTRPIPFRSTTRGRWFWNGCRGPQRSVSGSARWAVTGSCATPCAVRCTRSDRSSWKRLREARASSARPRAR